MNCRMNYIIFFIAFGVLAANAQNWMDQFGFGRGGGWVEFKDRDTGAHIQARKHSDAWSMGGMQIDHRDNPLFPGRRRRSSGNDFFRGMMSRAPAGTPNIGPGNLNNFFRHLGGASAGATNGGSTRGAQPGPGIVFGEGYGGSYGRAEGLGFGRGGGTVLGDGVIGRGEGFGMGYGRNGAEGYGRGPDMTSAMNEFKRWTGKK